MKKFSSFILLVLCLTLVFTLCACSGRETTGSETITETSAVPEKTEAQKSENVKHSRVKFTVKNFGEFIVELYPEYAPKTVENFLKLVNESFYENSTFHRVVDDFMAQGGISAKGKSAQTIPGEFASNGFAQNTLKHERGVISMARANNPDSASSQFFICYSEKYALSLDGKYAAFGKVIEGMEVIDKFCQVERSYNSRGEKATPVEDIVIEKAEVIG